LPYRCIDLLDGGLGDDCDDACDRPVRKPSLALADSLGMGAIAYNALIVFEFAHVAWLNLARTPPVASSLSVMLIPVLGVFSGAWMLVETPHWQDYAAMCLIIVSMSTVLLKPRATDPI
jgi:drug/metabolite transporter (DMT)-like permease